MMEASRNWNWQFTGRTIKKPYTGGTLDETRHFYYSNQWQVVEERVDNATTADRQFVWGMRYVDDLVLRDKGSDRLYALQDALFNVVALTDNTGAVKERFAYTPYGKSETLTSSFADRTSSLYDWEYRFTGRRLDLDTDLQLNRNRYYHNGIGRWVSRDPIGYADGLNLYEYVGGVAVRYVDPTGLDAVDVIDCYSKCARLYSNTNSRAVCNLNCRRRHLEKDPFSLDFGKGIKAMLGDVTTPAECGRQLFTKEIGALKTPYGDINATVGLSVSVVACKKNNGSRGLMAITTVSGGGEFCLGESVELPGVKKDSPWKKVTCRCKRLPKCETKAPRGSLSVAVSGKAGAVITGGISGSVELWPELGKLDGGVEIGIGYWAGAEVCLGVEGKVKQQDVIL